MSLVMDEGGIGTSASLSSKVAPVLKSRIRAYLANVSRGPSGVLAGVPVGAGGQPVPTAAIAQLLGHLSQQVAAEAEGVGEAEALGFMADAEGGFVGDPANAPDRAARLWDMMNEAMAERVIETIEAEYLATEGSEAESYDGDGEDI